MRASSMGVTKEQIWNHLMTAILTVGSVGKLIKDYLDASISSRLTFTVYKYGPTALATATSFVPPTNTLVIQAILEGATVLVGEFVWGDTESASNQITDAFQIDETPDKRSIPRLILCDGTNQFIRNVTGDTKDLKLVGWTLA